MNSFRSLRLMPGMWLIWSLSEKINHFRSILKWDRGYFTLIEGILAYLFNAWNNCDFADACSWKCWHPDYSEPQPAFECDIQKIRAFIEGTLAYHFDWWRNNNRRNELVSGEWPSADNSDCLANWNARAKRSFPWVTSSSGWWFMMFLLQITETNLLLGKERITFGYLELLQLQTTLLTLGER